MTVWLMSANAKKYDHQRAFEEQGFIYWRQIRKFNKGDIVFIYCTKPIGKIQYIAKVEEINIPKNVTLSDRKYYSDSNQQRDGYYIKLSLEKMYMGDKLDINDLSRFHFIPPQGPQRISNPDLVEYVKSILKETENE